MNKLHNLYRNLQRKKGINPDNPSPLVMILDNERDKALLQSYVKKEFSESSPLDLEKADDVFLETSKLANGRLEATILIEYHNGLNNYSAYFEAKDINETQVQEVLRNLGPKDKLRVHLKGNDYQEVAKKLRSYFAIYPEKVEKLHELGKKYQEDGFLCIDATILNKKGLHLRPAGMIVETTTKYDSEIFIQHNGEKVNVKSIMGVITLGLIKGDRITIKAKGSDADKALDELYYLIQNDFVKNNI